jgi:hypothetical protein
MLTGEMLPSEDWRRWRLYRPSMKRNMACFDLSLESAPV